VDINCSDKLEENIGPLGSLFHGFSVLYCMTTSLAWGGAGLDTVGFHEKRVHELCAEAGFRSVRRVPIENPFNNLYEITPWFTCATYDAEPNHGFTVDWVSGHGREKLFATLSNHVRKAPARWLALGIVPLHSAGQDCPPAHK
jgi:hypothetical protein